MISIVLYGRNDNYGYNLHKRAALSFNCMAEVLHNDGDEILFVDYNTPNDFPTFPEAIQDTLSEKARKRLRVFRVRPHVHRRFGSKTKLVALEPIARNIAVRRSNPENRWILSTNTDMIFVPRQRASLGEIARDLPAGFYHAPRIEIPETLWEGLDRKHARRAIETVREWGSALHINEIVLGSPVILYDGPGDFQLMQRADLFDINGFDEEMLLGWHVDSNMAKRLTMLRGKVGDLGREVYGYHCDHTRQITPAHSHSRTENDWRYFVDGIHRPDVPAQAKTWGCADDEIEEIRLTRQRTSAYVKALKKQIGEPQIAAPVVSYVGEAHNKTDYDLRHVLPYLADMFVSSERRINLAWFGTRADTLMRFAGFWRDLGFTGDILVDKALVREHGLATSPHAREVTFESLASKADAFVFDFGPISQSEDTIAGVPTQMVQGMNRALLRIMAAEHGTHEERTPRQVIAVNAINNTFESTIMSHVGAALTPFSTRMRHGFVLPPNNAQVDWTARLQVGEGGIRAASAIRSRRALSGIVAYGPYVHLLPGTYRLRMKMSAEASGTISGHTEIAVLEVVSNRDYLGHRLVTLSDLDKEEIQVEIDVTLDQAIDPRFSVQTLVRTLSSAEIAISGLTCERISDLKSTHAIESRALEVKEWLPLLWTGPEARRESGCIIHGSTAPGVVFYGPYWRLPEGNYEVTFTLEPLGDGSIPLGAFRERCDAARNILRHRLRRFYEEPVGQLAALPRVLRAQLGAAGKESGQTHASPGRPPLCTVQVISGEDELTRKQVFADAWRATNQVAVPFAVTALHARDPGFALEFRLLAHGLMPFGFKSVTVRRMRGAADPALSKDNA
ncbi:MAG: hypothetical protein JO068_23425 [Hyphomicrobiales bacterium]|nr:hypothetical protein [Hyphomicrobiales bacterium]